nr:MAG TPA: tail protein [Caudoviricetes sp.]
MGFFRGHTTTTRANKISEFTVSTAEYGSAVPEVLGTVRIAGNIIYYDDFTAHEHKEVQRAGKGGGSKHVNITYTYTVAAILGLCEGEIDGVSRVWVGKDVYTYPNEKIQMTLFKGSESQQPWAYTQGKHPEKALPYKGLAYVAGVVDLGDSGAFPSYNFEVKGKLLNTGDGIDVNPADYIRYVLDKAGLKDVEIQGLDNYRQYCKEADILISTPPDEKTKTVRDIVNEIAQLTNAYVFWSNDQFKIVPLADRPVGNWKPNKQIVYDLTSDDFIPQSEGELVRYERKDGSENYNQFPVEFINRSNGYEKETVTYQFTDDIKKYGSRQAGVFSANYIYTKERAVKIAEQIARINFYGRSRYTFKLDWCFCRLEVGDLVTLTDEYSGMEKQVAVITEVTEDQDGLLLFRAISMPDGNYEPAQYDVHENDRPYINMNDTACDTVPIMFQPPADMTKDGLELWIAAKGKEQNWGGCSVYVSDDNEHYIHAGDINNSSRLGQVKSYNEDRIKVTCNGQLLSGKPEDAERGNTICWVGGECLSYTTATLQSDGTYLLEGLVRGQYNTEKVSHKIGESFVRLDNYLLKLPFAKKDIGKKIYLKFVSKNLFGAGEQDLSTVKAYEYRLQKYFIPAVTGLTAYNRYRELSDGVSRYDIVVKWTPPELQSYLQGDVWYKTNHAQAVYTKIQPGTKADELGFLGDWIFGGSGKNQVVVPQAIVGDTYRIAVCTKDEWGAVTSPDTAPQADILVALKTTTPNTPDNFAISFSAEAVATWNEVVNADIMYYEIRTDTNPGAETQALLARTNNLSAALPLVSRAGTLYLYARSATGKYSAPAILTYNKPAPPKPNPPQLLAILGGFSVKTDTIPAGCAGIAMYIDGYSLTKVTSVNNTYTHTCEAGIYDVTVAFFDLFGEGEQSEESRIVVKDSVSAEMLEDEAVSLAKVDTALKTAVANANAAIPRLDGLDTDISRIDQTTASITQTVQGHTSDISQIRQTATSIQSTVQSNKTAQDAVNSGFTGDISQLRQTANTIQSTVQSNKTAQDSVNSGFSSQITQNSSSVTSIVTNLGSLAKAKQYYTAFTQLDNAINLRVAKGDVINQINISPTTTKIDGKYLHVTGQTVFDSNVIVSRMLQAGAVTTDKLAARAVTTDKLSIGSASGARMTLTPNLLRVYDSSGRLRIKMGVW